MQEGTCRPKNSEDLCGVQSPEPWWGPSGTLLINSLQCQVEVLCSSACVKFLNSLSISVLSSRQSFWAF